MSQSINWDLLEDQYLSDGIYREKLSKMVTIVDEAFLAGQKFARTYSEKISNKLNTVASPVTVRKDLNSQTNTNELNKPAKNIVTAKELEATGNKNEIVDVSKHVQELQTYKVLQTESFAHIEHLDEELKLLLNENKISKSLYEKLTSNEKFVLEPYDIDEINKLTKQQLKEVLLKCKVGESIDILHELDK